MSVDRIDVMGGRVFAAARYVVFQRRRVGSYHSRVWLARTRDPAPPCAGQGRQCRCRRHHSGSSGFGIDPSIFVVFGPLRRRTVVGVSGAKMCFEAPPQAHAVLWCVVVGAVVEPVGIGQGSRLSASVVVEKSQTPDGLPRGLGPKRKIACQVSQTPPIKNKVILSESFGHQTWNVWTHLSIRSHRISLAPK